MSLNMKLSMLLHKLGVQDQFSHPEPDLITGEWEQLLKSFEALGKKSDVLGLTAQDTREIWTFVELFNKLMPGLYCNRKIEGKEMSLMLKLFLERESQFFDNLAQFETSSDFFAFENLLDNLTLEKYTRQSAKEWFLFDDDPQLGTACAKADALSRFQRYAQEYDRHTRGVLSSRDKLREDYEGQITELNSRISDLEAQRKSRGESQHDFSAELLVIFDVICKNTREKSLLEIKEGLSRKPSRHDILKAAFQTYLESQLDKSLSRRRLGELARESEALQVKLCELESMHKKIQLERAQLLEEREDFADDTRAQNLEVSSLREQLKSAKDRVAELEQIVKQSESRSQREIEQTHETERLLSEMIALRDSQIRDLQRELEKSRLSEKCVRETLASLQSEKGPPTKRQKLSNHVLDSKITEIIEKSGESDLSNALMNIFRVYCPEKALSGKLDKIYKAIPLKKARHLLLLELFNKFMLKQVFA